MQLCRRGKGSGSKFGSYLDMPFSFEKTQLLPDPMTLKIKDKKIILLKRYFRQNYITGKIDLQGI